MEPAGILIQLLITGAIGSVLLTWLFFVTASRFVRCPVCRRAPSASEMHCTTCEKIVGIDVASKTRRNPSRPDVPRLPKTVSFDDGRVHHLYEVLCRLSRRDRMRLNALMMQHHCRPLESKQLKSAPLTNPESLNER